MPKRALYHSFRPGEVWTDTTGVPINAHGGGVTYDNGRYFWFGEHKIAGSAGNLAHVGVHVYASEDLYNWVDCGIALAVESDPSSPIAAGCVLERPKVVRCPTTGCYVMWFHLEPPGVGYMGARVGVATADCVTGPYKFVRAFRPNAGRWPANVPPEARAMLSEQEADYVRSLNMVGGPVRGYPEDLIYRRDLEGGQMSRDQTLFVDPADNAAYHVHASEDNGTLHISRLRDADWLDTDGLYTRHFPGGFHEAPALFRHNGRVWLITSGCTGWTPNAARLSVADSPMGPWRQLGNPCRGSQQQIATTFDAQSTFVLPVAGKRDAFIFMADRWQPDNAIDGRYVWLPVEWDDKQPVLRWSDEWSLDVFR